MTAIVAMLLVLVGLVVVVAVGSRLLVWLVPSRRVQERRFRAVAEALGGRFGRSLVVADAELRLWLHGHPVFVTSSFGKHGYEASWVRIEALEGAPWPGIHLDLVPGQGVEHEGIGDDGRAAAEELGALVGQPCGLEIRQKLWGEQGFAELSCGGFLSDRDDAPEALARAIQLIQRVAFDLTPTPEAGEAEQA